MGFTPAVWRFRSAERARVLLICPQCGQETSEYADKLRGQSHYHCPGADCDYRFVLTTQPGENAAGKGLLKLE
jgi:transposase-like protein